jgi:ComF family protein
MKRNGSPRVQSLPFDPIGLLLPPTCLLCGAPGEDGLDLCAGCAADLPRNAPCCPRCALPLAAPLPAGTLCGACQRRPPPFERCIAPLRYQDPVPYLVAAAKFRGRLNAARLLGLLLARALEEGAIERPEVLIPVPLHRARLAERGYNQALEMARPVARALALPLDIACCTRAIATAPQTGLDERARRRNIHGAFAALTPLPWGRVAVLDDVVTTGSTVAELARVLRRAGANRVEVWAVARTP